MTPEEIEKKYYQLEKREKRFRERYNRDWDEFVKEATPFCQHTIKTKSYIELDDGYGHQSKREFEYCLVCGAKNIWGTWKNSAYWE